MNLCNPSRRWLIVAACLAILVSANRRAVAQDTTAGGDAGTTNLPLVGSLFIPATGPSNRMQEDIEIMRALLNRTLSAASTNVSSQFGVYGLQANAMYSLSAGSGMAANSTGGMSGSGIVDPAGNTWGSTGVMMGGAGPGGGASWNPEFEGSYLKGQGVVFTATLPLALADAAGVVPGEARKEPGEWEQVRGHLSGANPPESAGREMQSLDAALLALIARHGRNFKELPDNEGITIVVTFRGGPTAMMAGIGMMGASPPMYGAGGGAGLLGGGAAGPPAAAGEPGGTSGPPQEGSGDAAAPTGAAGGVYFPGQNVRVDLQNLEMLAELHLKQGNAKEAVAVLEKAAGERPTLAQAAKLARAYAALEDPDSLQRAQKVLAEALARQEGGAGANAATGASGTPSPAVPLPRKLIISAGKALLNQTGQISHEEFVRQASVQAY